MILLSGVAHAAWPLYGHDIANTRDAGSDGPSLAAIPTLKAAWRFMSSSDFTGTPVVAKGLVVAGDFAGTVYAIDAVTGKLHWKKALGQPINGSAAIDMHAAGGPAVYVPLQQVGSPRVAALSLRNGKIRWNTVLTNQPTSSMYASPTVWNGNVYVGTSGPNGDGSTARGTVVSLDGTTGAVRWRTYTVPSGHDGGAVWATPAIDPATGTVFVGTGNAYHAPAADTTDSVLALNSATGQILAHYQATGGDIFGSDNPAGADVDFGASPNLMEGPSGQALLGEGAKDGNYYALDRSTLGLVWRTSIGPGSAVGGLVGSTVYDGTRVYGSDGLTSQVAAIDRGGSLKWSSADGGSLDFSPLAMANGVLYTANQAGFLTAREAVTGTVLKKLHLGGQTFGGISTTGGALYVAIGIGPPPSPAPQVSGSGSIVAFGDTSRSGPAPGPPRTPRIRLVGRPAQVPAGRKTVFRFRARARGHWLRGATIRFAGHQVRTGRKGPTTIVARLSRGTHVARAFKPGFRRGVAAVRARNSPAFDGRRPRRYSSERGTDFSGRCQFSGPVTFQPALTNSSQPVEQHVRAPGACSGTFVDRHGGAHQLANAPVTYRASGRSNAASCTSGAATGRGALRLRYGQLHFALSETRGAGAVVMSLAGARAGSAKGIATVGPSENPATIVQRCAGSGNRKIDIGINISALTIAG